MDFIEPSYSFNGAQKPYIGQETLFNKTMGNLPTTTALSIYGHWTGAIASSAKEID